MNCVAVKTEFLIIIDNIEQFILDQIYQGGFMEGAVWRGENEQFLQKNPLIYSFLELNINIRKFFVVLI